MEQRLKRGTQVRTTQADESQRGEWEPGTWEMRKWGVRGYVIDHHDSHGLCYDVSHPDGSWGCYNPNEIEVVKVSTEKGPWGAEIIDGKEVHIFSDDFEHDVGLRIGGDFATINDKLAYGKKIAAILNAGMPFEFEVGNESSTEH